MKATTVRNVVMSALLSITLTIFFAVLYTLYPLILVSLSAIFSTAGDGGIAVVAGGVSVPFFKTLCPVALILFLIIFGLLQRRRVIVVDSGLAARERSIKSLPGLLLLGFWRCLPEHVNDLPLAIILCQMHVIDTPECG